MPTNMLKMLLCSLGESRWTITSSEINASAHGVHISHKVLAWTSPGLIDAHRLSPPEPNWKYIPPLGLLRIDTQSTSLHRRLMGSPNLVPKDIRTCIYRKITNLNIQFSLSCLMDLNHLLLQDTLLPSTRITLQVDQHLFPSSHLHFPPIQNDVQQPRGHLQGRLMSVQGNKEKRGQVEAKKPRARGQRGSGDCRAPSAYITLTLTSRPYLLIGRGSPKFQLAILLPNPNVSHANTFQAFQLTILMLLLSRCPSKSQTSTLS